MLLVYLDESYKRRRHYWLAACAVSDEQVADLCSGVREAAARIPAEFGLRPDIELHAQHLYHGDKEFLPLKEFVRVRVQTYRRGLGALCTAAPAIFFVGVEWNDDLPTYHRLATHRLAALRHLLPELEAHCAGEGERCIVVADEEETSTAEVVAVVREHQRTCEEGGERSRVLDVPFFTPSHYSAGVQACDLAAFLHARRRFARPDEDKRAAKVLEDWWRMVAPHVVLGHCHPAPSKTDALVAEEVSKRTAEARRAAQGGSTAG